MNSDRPSTQRIVWTLVGWGVGLIAVGALLFAIAWGLTPKAVTAPAPGSESSATVVATQSAAPTTLPQPATAPTPAVPATVATHVASVPATRTVTTGILSGKIIAIDAGHQLHGDNSLEPIGPGSNIRKPKVAGGATGVATHQSESSVNLAVALKLRDALIAKGAHVVMIRTKQNVNISNSERAKIANAAHAELFIRLHCDGSTDHSQSGLSTLVPGSNQWTKPIVSESGLAGSYVNNAVIAATGARNRGIVKRADLSGFNWSTVPTVLVEMGFLSNAAEDRQLATSAYQTKLATGLAAGITAYLQSR